MTLKNYRTPLLYHIKFCSSFQSHRWIKTWVQKPSIRVEIGDFSSRVTLKFDKWPWKTIGRIFYAASSFVHHFVAISEFKLELQSENVQFGSKSTIFCLEIWRVTLQNNRTHLLSNIKLCASFHHHMWIQIGVMVRKRINWVLTSVTLTFDL